MKKLFAILFTFALFALLFAGGANAQIPVTVTNPGNTTPNLQANYSSLAAALTDLNLVTAMTGPVTLTLTGSNSETTPPTGLLIGSATLNPVLSATNTVTIIASGGVVTLNAGVGTATPSSAAPDGILTIVGADYITIDGLTLTDGNITNPATMEFGVALFKRSTSDGARYNIIKNCTFNMQRINWATGTAPMVEGSVGILVINSTNTAATTALSPVSALGTNSNNKFYANILNNGNYGIVLSGYAAPSTFYLGDTGNDIGGSNLSQGNQILNFGGGVSSTNPSAGIRANNQWGINISYNTINNNNGSGVNHTSTLRGIYAQAGTSANATISYNNVTVKSGATTSAVYGIDNGIGVTPSSNTVNINNNTVTGSYTTATTGIFYAINNTADAANININYNTISNISTPGTGAIYCVNHLAGFSNTLVTETYNNISTITKTGNGAIYAFITGGSPAVINQNNTVDGISCTVASGTSNYFGYYTLSVEITVENISNNIFRNFSGTGTAGLYGIRLNTGAGSRTIQNNQVYNFSVTGAGNIFGISKATGSPGSTDTISGNNIHNLQTAGGSIYGLQNTAGTTINIYDNQIYGLSSITGTAAGYIYGLSSSTGTTVNIFKNNISNLSSAATTTPVVYGLQIAGGTTNNIYNNFISDLRAPSSPQVLSLIGFYITSGTTVNLFYNSVYINAASTGSTFGSSALYIPTTTTLNMRDNILVNVSIPAGATGFTTAYRRSTTNLAKYDSTSNNNCFYAGTPGTKNLIFYDGTNSDQTIAAYKSRVSPRDSSSFSELPPFINVSAAPFNLHLNPSISSQCESSGIPITSPISVTTDYDGDMRNASTPDVGADEYTYASPSLNLGLTALLSGFYNGTTMIPDSVTVELHNSTTPYALVDSKKVLLDANGLGNPLYTTAVNGIPYYIVLRFSNGLETWSATPQTFNGSALSYDFTSAATQAYGSNMLLVGTKWCVISGDANQDGSVDALDRSACWNDRNLTGIYVTDLNGDGVVDALDRSIAWNNRNLSVQKPSLIASPGIKQDNKSFKDNTRGTLDLKLNGSNSKKHKIK